MADKRTLNDIRNVLMNDLGLTREAIREQVDKIVNETVEKRVDFLLSKENLPQIVSRIVTSQFTETSSLRYGQNKLRGLILEKAKEEVEKFINEHIAFTSTSHSK